MLLIASLSDLFHKLVIITVHFQPLYYQKLESGISFGIFIPTSINPTSLITFFLRLLPIQTVLIFS